MTEKDFAYYLSLPYTVELQQSSNGTWFSRIKELPGCGTQGETREEALAMLDDAMRGWLAVSLEDGDPIPEPRLEEDYSGQFRVRVTRSLHRKLVEAADDEGVSLNHFISIALGEAVAGRGIKVESGRPGPRETTVVSLWPGLGAKASQVLAAAGLTSEAAEADERLFTDWLLERLSELATAYSQGSYIAVSQGLDYLVLVTQRGEPSRGALRPLARTLLLLKSIIAESIKRDQELLDPGVLTQRLTEALRARELRQLAPAPIAFEEGTVAQSRSREAKILHISGARRTANAQ